LTGKYRTICQQAARCSSPEIETETRQNPIAGLQLAGGPLFWAEVNDVCNRVGRWGWTAAVAVAWLLGAPTARGWESLTFDLPSGAKESLWRDELSRRLGGMTEVRVEGGRIDVMTDGEAIEVDFPHKWHEGVGQALHYASETGKQGVLAIVAYAQGDENLQVKTRRRLELIERVCEGNGLKMMVLFPNRGGEK
jgi:hypothetical protein